MSDDVSFVFVYGTLLEGASNHARFCSDALTIEPAITTGRLYHLPQGYPAMIEADDAQVHGEAITFPDLPAKLSALDILEGYRPDDPEHSLYLRRVRPVTLCNSRLTVPAYCYIWRGQLPAGSQLVPSGRWRPGGDGPSIRYPTTERKRTTHAKDA